MIIVDSMHERKAKMINLADGFIAMPGGFGTFEELFEIITWQQLGFHQKPCALFNVNGYYDRLKEFLEKSVNEGFVKAAHFEMLIIRKNLNVRRGYNFLKIILTNQMNSRLIFLYRRKFF